MSDNKYIKIFWQYIFEISVIVCFLRLIKFCNEHGNWLFDGDLIIIFLIMFWIRNFLYKL